MKKLIVLLFVALGTQVYSQEVEITESNICGKWEFLDIINPDLKQDEIDEMKSMLESTYLDFKSDKTCVIGIIMDLDGTWTLDSAKKNIITKTRRGETTWVLHSLTKELLTTSRNDAKQKVVFKKL